MAAVLILTASLLAMVGFSVAAPPAGAVVQCSAQAQQALSDYGPIPAPGASVPGAPPCFKIFLPGAGGTSRVLHVNDPKDPQSGDGIVISPVADAATVSGEYWTLVTQGTSGSYWTAGTSYLLQSYNTNLCLQRNGSANLQLGSCDGSPTVFNITAALGTDDFTNQIATGVFGGAKSSQCLTESVAAGIFAACDSTDNAGQRWTFSGPSGWLTKSQIESANAGTCPHGGTGAACTFTADDAASAHAPDAAGLATRIGQAAPHAAPAAAARAARARHILTDNMCATDPLGNPLDAYQAPLGAPSGNDNTYAAAFNGTLTTTSTVSASVNASIAFALTNSFEQQKTDTTGTTGLVTALTTVYDLKTISTQTTFTVGATITGTYALATAASTTVTATIGYVPPGDFAWFSVRNTFAAVAGHVAVPSKKVGNYSIPVPNFVLPTLPPAGQPANTSQVPTTIKQGAPGTGGTVEGHLASSFTVVSPADCSPPIPAIKSGQTSEIDNAATGLTMSGGGKCAAGSGVVQANYTVSKDEKWRITAAGNGNYALTNQCGLRLTDPNSSNQPALPLTHAPQTGSANQLWKIRPVYGTDFWTLQSYASGLWLSLATAGGQATGAATLSGVGSPITQDVAQASGGDATKASTPGITQEWRIHTPGTKPVGPPVHTNTIDPGSYEILNVAGGMALSSTNHSCKVNGDSEIQDAYAATADQIWAVAKNGTSYTLINKCSLSLTDPNASTTAGTGLTQFTKKIGSASQRWNVSPVKGGSHWTIQNAASGLYATLADPAAGGKVTEQPLDGKDATGNPVPGTDQQWDFNLSSGAQKQPGGGNAGGPSNQVTAGAYQLINSATGLALGSARNDCQTNGTGLIQDQYRDQKSQIWNISYNGNATYSVANNCPMALNVPNASTVSGTPLTQNTRNKAASQLWTLTPIEGTNNWALQSYPTNQYVTPSGNEVGSRIIEQSPTGVDGAPAANQQWRLVVANSLGGPATGGGANGVSTGTYELANASTKTALSSIGHDCATPGTKLGLDQYHGKKDQLWTVTDNRNGTYTVVNRCPLAATNPASSTQTGSPLTENNRAANDPSQLWILAPVAGSGHWTIQNYASNLYVTAGGTGVASPVLQQPLDGKDAGTSGPDQEWDLILAPPATDAPPTNNNDQIQDGVYQLSNVASGLAAGSAKHTCATDGTRLGVDAYHGSKDQLWTVTHNANDTYTLVNKCPFTATNPNSSTTAGSALTEARSGTAATQRWIITPVTGSGHWTIQNLASNQYVTEDGNTVGDKIVQTPLAINTTTSAPQQQWDFTLNPPAPPTPPTPDSNQVGTGVYELANVSTGMALGSAQHGCATSGTKLSQDQYHADNDQRWTITNKSDGTYTLVNQCPMAATNANNSTVPGSPLTATTPANSGDQLWIITPVAGTDNWTVQSLSSDLYVTVSASNVGSTVLQQNLDGPTSSAGADQQWTLTLNPPAPPTPPTPQGNQVSPGDYEFSNVATGMALGSNAHDCATNGTKLAQDQFHGDRDQVWTITRNDDGTYTLINKCPMVATNPNSSTTSGSALTELAQTDQSAGNQIWIIAPVSGTGHWTVQNFASDMYVTSGGGKVGSVIVQQPGSGDSSAAGPEQQWDLTLNPVTPTTPVTPSSNQIASGIYQLANVATSLSIGTSLHDCRTSGTWLTQDKFQASKDQLWTVTNNGNGTYTLVNECPMALTDPNSSTTAGTTLDADKTSGSANQLWVIAPVAGTDHWTVVSYFSDLYVSAASSAGGSQLTQLAPKGDSSTAAPEQQWDLTLAPPAANTPPTTGANQVANGVYELTNAGSGLALGSTDHTCTTAGTKLAQDKYLASSDQLWTITNNGNGTYTLVSKCPMAATDPNSSTIANSPLTQNPASGGSEQLWVITPVPNTNHWTVQSYVSNQLMTASGNSAGDGVVQQPLPAGATVATVGQQWTLVLAPAGPGTPSTPSTNQVTFGVYELSNVATGTALGSLQHGCTTPDTKLALDRYQGSKDQLWTATNNGNGSYTLINKCPMAATDPDSSTVAGTELSQFPANGKPAQLWIIKPVPGTGHWTIQSYVGNLYATAAESGLGAGVTQQALRGSATAPASEQQWDLTLSPPATNVPSTGGTNTLAAGAYKITNVASVLSIGATFNDCGTNGINLAQDRYQASKDQVWNLTNNGNGTYTLINRCNVSMADPNSSVAPGVKIAQYTHSSASNQLWIITPVPGTNHWTIQSYVSNLYLTAAGTTVGANITQQPSSASKTAVGSDQQWDLTLASQAMVEPGTGSGTSRVANGSYRVINASSALSLSVAGIRCWHPSGTVVVNQYSNTVDQRWNIATNADGTYTLTSDCQMRLTDPNSATAVGTPLVQSTVTNVASQHWQITPVAGTNNWTIRAFASNLFATAAGGAVGSTVVQADFNSGGGTTNGPLQQWTLVPTTGGASATGLSAAAHAEGGLLGDSGGGSSSGSGLAYTGAGNLTILLGVMTLLIAFGAVLIVGARRRRPTSATALAGAPEPDSPALDA